MATGRLTLPAALIVSLTLWAMHLDSHYALIGMAICYISAYLLYGLDSAFGIIKVRSYLAPAFFMLLYTASSSLEDFSNINIVIPSLYIVSLFYIIKGYESRNPPADIFNGFLCSGLGCITDNHLLLVIPVLFLCMIQLRSMSVRGILAAILGFMSIFWIISGYLIFMNRSEELIVMTKNFLQIEWFNYNSISINQWVCTGVLFFIFAFSGFLARRLSLNDKVKTRSIIKSLNITGSYLFAVIILIPSAGTILIPILMLISSILYSYTMTILYNRFTLILMISSLLMILGIAGLNIIY